MQAVSKGNPYRSVWAVLLLAASMSTTGGCVPPDADDGPPSTAIAQHTRAIINGEACNEETMPSAVALLVDATVVIEFPGFPPAELPIRTVLCTGTLIAPDVVLTAAHCVDPSVLLGDLGTFEDSTYYVSFTADLQQLELDPTAPPGTLPDLPDDAAPVAAMVANPDFSVDLLRQTTGGLTNLYDVALVFLEQPVSAVEPAIVITKEEATQLVEKNPVEIAGWGQQTAAPQNPFEPPPPGTVAMKICAESFINKIGEYEMQIGDGPETSRKCHGDSGGPTYMKVETEHERDVRVVGITSHAFDQTDCAKGGVDTRVDVWLDWIDQQMRAACQDGTRSACDEHEGIIPPGYYDPPPPEPDAGVDAGATDASSSDGDPDEGDAGDEGGSGGGGCDCAVGQQDAPPAGRLLLVGLIAALLLARSRRWWRPPRP